MKHFLKDNWFKIFVIVVTVVVIGCGFYWFQVRPMDIRKDCWAKAYREAKGFNGDRADVNYFYTRCFREKGLEDHY